MIHVLDFDGNIVDFLSRKDESVIEAKHLINVQDDIETFDFTVISDRGEFVRERNRVVVEISPNKFREFIIIKTVDEMDGYTEVNCVGSHLEDISKSKPITPTTLKTLTLDEIMYEVLRGTGWNVGDIDFLGGRTYNIEKHVSPFEVMKEIKKLFGHEYEFEVVIDGNKIIERKVNCVIPNSVFNGREIVYGKDLIGMTRTVDTENVVTAYLVIGPEYAPNKRLIAEVTDRQAQDKFGVKGDFLWGILEVDDEEARKGVPATTTTSTTRKPKVTTTTTKKKYTRATTRVVGTKTHTVRKGDTLYTIAQKYNVTQQSIKEANKLKSTKIKVGQRLKIVITAKVTTTTTRSTTKKPTTTTTTTVMQKVEQDGIIANLKKIGQREIDKVNQASLSYEITSLDVRKEYPHEIINIGDKVRIKNRDFKPPLYADARVIEIETDIISNEQTYKFGSIKEYSENSLRSYFKSLQKKFEQKLEDNIKNLDTIIESKIDNTEVFERAITKSEYPPENPVNGTLWYDISNPDLAVIREYRDGEWVGATAEDISQIGGMTVEQIAFGQLMQLYAVVVGEMNGLENSYNEILESEYMDREDIKEELKTAYNSMQELFLSVTDLTTSIEEETVTMDELDTLNNDMIEYKHSVTDFYVIIEKAKKYIQEKIKILQSQYTEEKFNDAMDKVAKAIDGAYDKETGNLIANVPNQDQITKLIEDLKAYSDENDGKLKSNIETTITNKITDSETEFGRQFTEIEKKIDLVKVGGKNLLLKSNNNKTSVEHLVNTYDLSEDWTNEEYTITVWGTVNSDEQGFVLVTDNKEIETVYLKPNDDRTIWTATFNSKVDKSNLLLVKRTLSIYNFPEENAGTSNIIKAKLEKGNKSTDWTPAPEDINNIVNDISIAISKVDGEVSATKDRFSTVYTKEETITKVNESLEPIKNLVNNNKSGIIQLSDSLKSYVKATDYATDKDNIVQRLSNTESGMDILSNKIGLAVTKDDYQKGIEETKKYADDIVDNIVVGGRNLLRNSNFSTKDLSKWNINGTVSFEAIDGYNTAKVTNKSSLGFYQSPTETEDGAIYTLSFLAKSIGEKSIVKIGYVGQESGLSQSIEINNKWNRYTFTTNKPFNKAVNNIFHIYSSTISNEGFYITNIKLEKGNVATDWTPAPEDLVSSVNDLQVGLDNYKEYISKSFKDTVITESEAKAIEQQKVFLESQKITLDNQYDSLYNNSILDNTEEKKALLSAKTNYETSYVKLIEAINSVISDGRANAQETAGVLAKFDVYKDNLGKLAKQLEDTNDAITTGKVKRINVGTRNLIDSMSLNLSGKGVTGDTEELTMGEWAYNILGNSWVKKKLKSNTTYTISYTVELISKPTTKSATTVFGRTYLYSPTNANSRVIMGELPSGYYDTMKVGDMYSVKNTFTTPTLSDDTYVIFYNAIHGVSPYEKSVAKFHNIILSEGNTIGDYQRAPEDLDERLRTMKANIDVLENNINLKVSEENFNKTKETLSKAVSLIDILSDNVTISTEKDGSKSIGEFNPDSIKLDSKIIDLNNGDLTIQNGVATIKDAYIPKLFSKRATIEYLDAIGITARTLQARDKQASVNIENGSITMNRDNGARMDIGLDGIQSFNNGGSLRFSLTPTLVTTSAVGTSVSNVYLGTAPTGEARVVNMNGIPGDGEIGSYAYRPIRTLAIKFPLKSNGYIGIDGSELRVMSDGLVEGGYKDVRASGFIGNTLDVNTYANGTHLYLRSTSNGEVKFTNIGTTDVYSDARAGGMYVAFLDYNSHISNGGHMYIRPRNGHEVKLTYTGTTNQFANLRSDGIYAPWIDFNGQISGSHLYIRPGSGGEVKFTRTGTTDVWANIRFGSWNAMSHEKYKNSIQIWDYNVLDIYRNELVLHSYKVDSEAETLYDRIHHGIVLRENPNLDQFPVEWRNGDGFDGNEVLWWNTKATQELAFENVDLKNDVAILKKDNVILQSKLNNLEDRLKILEEKLNGR